MPPHLHSPWVSGAGEAARFWELCRREGPLLECRGISSAGVGSLLSPQPHPPSWAHPDVTQEICPLEEEWRCSPFPGAPGTVCPHLAAFRKTLRVLLVGGRGDTSHQRGNSQEPVSANLPVSRWCLRSGVVLWAGRAWHAAPAGSVPPALLSMTFGVWPAHSGVPLTVRLRLSHVSSWPPFAVAGPS